MEDIAVYCSWADAQLDRHHSFLRALPIKVRLLILQSIPPHYLDVLANTIRDARYTDALFPLYKPLFPDVLARWTTATSSSNLHDIITTVSCLARVFPLATYLRPHLKALLNTQRLRYCLLEPETLPELEDDAVISLLLALFRCLSFERDMLTDNVGPAFFSPLLQHSSLPVRYLAIQCLCMFMHLADAYSENLAETYIGRQAILGTWEGKSIDYRLLKLFEERRWNDLAKAVEGVEESWQQISSHPSTTRILAVTDLSPHTANVGGVLLPRISNQFASAQDQSFVLTKTAKQNLHQLGRHLLENKPILISGQAGSGKTSLVHEAARLLNQQLSMITLHLNEQTDAKSLLGIHTSSTDGNSFIWQPGVLTKAMQQGRWVLIEDIDRAPTEVMGVLRPILENGELFLPSRKEKIRPREGFRIVATVKTSEKPSSVTASRYSWLDNPRIWSTVEASIYPHEEIQTLLRSKYSATDVFIDTILLTHQSLSQLYEMHRLLKGLQTRKPTLRDLLNLSRRMVRRLHKVGVVSASTALPEVTKLDIFRDAVDCYAGHLDNEELHEVVATSIAASMDVPPQQMRYCLDAAFTSLNETNDLIQIGRSTLAKVLSRRRQTRRAPFALTTTTRRVLDSIAASVECSEPCLLVGETGVGKTTMVQHVANMVGHVLTVINLSQQSEAGDLLGGLKPVTTRSLILPVVEKFSVLFDDTFSAKRNEKFQIALAKTIAKQNWPRLMILWDQAVQMAAASLKTADVGNTNGVVPSTKKRKLESPRYENLRKRWADFSESFQEVRSFVERGEKTHAFTFVEGRLVDAVRNGEWILLDEINLAPSDTLDHIATLLQNRDEGRPSLLLAEAGNIETIVAHPNFRLFAAMNPATDAGKKDLVLGLRSRFTEIYVSSGDRTPEDLTMIVQTYIGPQLDNDKRAALDLAKSYLALRELNEEHQLTDGAGETPHFSIRSLVRCLLYVLQHGASHGLRRAMYEGFAMSFFTVLSRASEKLASPFLESHLLSNVKNREAFFAQQPKMSHGDGEVFMAFRHHLVKKGPMTPDFQPHYIRTPSVERNLLNLARAASMRRFPILLQGPTSAGKTSMVEYLAKLSGNKLVRINNHEHTDLQEYLGSYVSDVDGKLVYREGVLVDALRSGHWIVLDELNLAPSDVLEEINILLDDNRELLIPQSQEIVRPHPNFMLFGTQNPAGLYGGRKRLSRAFRNRFLEIHFDDIPEDELEVILRERSQIAPSFCTKIVAVYKSLCLLRQSLRLFEQRNSFATLRDLFRWASRPVDDWESLAYHGFMLLTERVRDPVERMEVKNTVQKEIKVTLDEDVLYSMSKVPDAVRKLDSIVWTPAMRRVFVLVAEALKNKEPVLLVGETGCGKTQICQVIAEAFRRPLHIYNAHTNTETGDLVGSQRPVRNQSELAINVRASWEALIRSGNDDSMAEDLDVDQIIEKFTKLDQSKYDVETIKQVRFSVGAYQALFAWNDGSLVRAMKRGEHFLLDEISLAEDSVLERLNSVLEPSRTILLAEKGSFDNLVTAHPDFQFLSTMNPAGDYGKRELSAALRNRLTEIWMPPLTHEGDILPVVQKKLPPKRRYLAEKLLKFAVWFQIQFHSVESESIPLRNLIAWADFISLAESLTAEAAFVHGAFMVYIDSLGANPAGMTSSANTDLSQSRQRCLGFLRDLVGPDTVDHCCQKPELSATGKRLLVGQFSLPQSPSTDRVHANIVFDAPTTLRNTMRIVRALQMRRPILLEGSPGVGKTAIVTALAQACGKQFSRINLSDQTDLMDLFGADAPSENEEMGQFSWQDGPLLEAMQSGGWILLDEMNLASQSVLEGLNACLDHRREVYIAELDRVFTCHPEFILFAAQNPHFQGGGRKGLPASFVNRFTIVYADPFQHEDLMCICQSRYPDINNNQLETLVSTITQIGDVVARAPAFAQGGPWDVNLRDVSRWLRLYRDQPALPLSHHLRSIVTGRFRTSVQRELVMTRSEKSLGSTTPESLYNNISQTSFQIGTAFLPRDAVLQSSEAPKSTLSVGQLPAANSIIVAMRQNWPVILSGSSGAGKTSLIRHMAATAGVELVEFSLSADVDAMDLVGGFEQYDVRRDVAKFQAQVRQILRLRIAKLVQVGDNEQEREQLLRLWQSFAIDELKIEDAQAMLSSLSVALPELYEAVEAIWTTFQTANRQGFRFVWNDGVLVDTLRKGSWFVLDNANLCNPSVLDRLNSLLESDGQLTISERHNGEADARVIKAHPNFRIFMTMDPRHGELSRAIRNRSLEICLPDVHQVQHNIPIVQYPLSSTISRLRPLFEVSDPQMIESSMDNLNIGDIALLSENADILPGTQGAAALQTELNIRESHNVGLVQQISGVPKRRKTAVWPQLAVLNEPLVLLTESTLHRVKTVDPAELFVRCWYLTRRITEINTLLKNAAAQAGTLTLKDRTVLDRSISLRDSKEPGGTPNVAAFAQLVISSIFAAVKMEVSDSKRTELLGPLEQMLAFTHDVLVYANTKTIDVAYFQALLQFGGNIVNTVGENSPDLASTFSTWLHGLLGHESVLATGFGLKQMWPIFRPKTPPSLSQLRTQLALEELIGRFDRICRYLPETRTSLSRVRSNLCSTFQSITDSDQPETSMLVLQDAVAGLEVQSKNGFMLEGKLEDAMRFIYEVVTFQAKMSDKFDLELLSMFAPRTNIYLANTGVETPVPMSLARLASFDARTLADDGSIGTKLAQRLSSINSQPLGMLNYAREELQVLVKALCSHTDAFEDLVQPLTKSIHIILGGILFSQYEHLTQQAQACFSGEGLLDLDGLAAVPATDGFLPGQRHDRFRDVYLNLLHPVLLGLEKPQVKRQDLGTSLVKLSLAGLVLMVPDKLSDPAIYPMVKHQLHGRRVAELSSRIDGHRLFHKRVIGQETALVIRILEQELLKLGTSTPPPTVLRPSKEEHIKLHEVFTRIVNVVLSPPITRTDPEIALRGKEWTEQWATAHGKSNLKTIIDRLENVHRAYDDFAKPILWFLKCLSLGLELVSVGTASSSGRGVVDELVDTTPLLSVNPTMIQDWRLSATSGPELRLHWLQHIVLRSTLAKRQDYLPIDDFHKILDSFYHEWKTCLTRDQAEVVTKSRYYTYRGDLAKDDEEDDHEMSEMFSDLGNDGLEVEEPETPWDARATATKLSVVHQKIYSEQDPQHAMQSLIVSTLEVFTKDSERSTSSPGISFSGLLPAILLQAESKIVELKGSQQSQGLNIYTDSDIMQSQRLFDLVRQIQSRFYTIQEKWPEHAVPAEVLSFCTEVFRLSFGDPVAKLLTKTEKLYEIVSQWQSIASREWSVSELVESLSSLIISWRRLELSSWSRLLDEEKRKHEKDAHAWYFIAYEALIHNSNKINPDNGDLSAYQKTLVHTVEEYFKSTTVGQYSSRLKLLDTLNKTLQSIARDQQHLRSIATSVQNVIDHYSQYQAGIDASLQKGRVELEKALNKQIKLASWKDTNIITLRESARRSHHTLFKIVRKYRALLSQVVVFNPSDEPKQQFSRTELVGGLSPARSTTAQVDPAIKQCRLRLEDWDRRPERLSNPLGAARSMQHLYSSTTSELQVHNEIASFRQELGNDIKELRTQTPPNLTEDNASFIRHLQERKRRVLSDTLKQVAHMGIRRNLPTSELEKQSSTAAILTSAVDIRIEQLSTPGSATDSTFHDLLDSMPQVRTARTEHSDDLADGEVNRSVGLLEGLLSVVIRQRQTIPKQAFDLKALDSWMAMLRRITSSYPHELVKFSAARKTVEGVYDRLAWLGEILTTSCRILRFQAEHGNLDINGLIDTMESRAVQVKALRRELHEQPDAPTGMVWGASRALLEKTCEALVHLQSSLRHWQVRVPQVKFLLSKVIVWTEDISILLNEGQDHDSEISIHEFDQDLRTVLDEIFVSLQKLSGTQSGMPKSEEYPGWLVKSDKLVVETIRSSRIDTIVQQLDHSVMSKLQYLSSADLGAAQNLLTIAMPIIEQFFYICEHLHNRQTAIHVETCRLALDLARSFMALARQGFCRPLDPAEGQEEQSGKLESGTGLGEGEGTEDISKDVQDDEDLTEVAQQGQKEERDEDLEDVDEAVDMGHEDLEGEMGELDGKTSDQGGSEDRSGDEDENEIDEEAGSVDDRDPNAVDEKMWVDMKKESEEKDKEMKSDMANGQKSEDQTAADGEKAVGEDMEGLEGEEQETSEGDQDGDDGGERPEGEHLEAHVDEGKALDLPEELDLAGKDGLKDDDISEAGMDQLSDIDHPTEEVQDGLIDEVENTQNQEQRWDETASIDDLDVEDAEAEHAVGQDDEIMEDQPEGPVEDQPDDHDTRQDGAAHDIEENTGAESGVASEVQDNVGANQNIEGLNEADKDSNPQQSQPGKAPKNEEEGRTGKGVNERGSGRAGTLEPQQNESLRKLADILDQWHQRREILPASAKQIHEEQEVDVDMADADFEHVQDEDQGNAQALGAAGTNQAQTLDQSKAIEDGDDPLNDDTALPGVLEPEIQEDVAERYRRLKAQSKLSGAREAGAFMPDRQPQVIDSSREQEDMATASDDLSPDIEQLELSNNRTKPTVHPTSATHAAQVWHHCSMTTHQFSLILTEQLRLILSPTTATKLRGDYRTGKRLNIKRIIPYIASNYKRDKIWMRRSVPSKRNYQIMIAVDDSKSMSESGADVLAFETLALLTKSLAMLEVGEICVVGFGDAPQITVAHPFGMPFSLAESGPSVFQAFSFEQRGTDVKSLVRQSIQLLRDARQQRQGGGEEQWQLQLIVSDGHISDHEAIARLVRQAHDDERIVIVFVIVDAGQESILDLKEAVYAHDPTAAGNGAGNEMKLRMKRYLDGFPFPYYLVVRDMRDLPGVLATALKGWFGTVVNVQ